MARTAPHVERSGGRGRTLRQVLLDLAFVTPEQMEEAEKERSRTKKTLGRLLIELGYVTEPQLTHVLAVTLGHEFVDLSEYGIDPTASSLVPESLARRYKVVPIGLEEGKVVLAISDPTNVIALDDIRTFTKRDIKIVVASRGDIDDALNRLRAADSSAADLLQAAAEDEETEDSGLVTSAEEEAPIVKAINQIIIAGVQKRASDIHIEPQERDVRIRYRIDGVLHVESHAQKSLHSGMVSRLKIMADLDIAEKRVPQDGRVSVNVAGNPIDLRVATLPSVWGEKVVMRILDRASSVMRLEDLGFLPDAQKRFEESIRKPYGMILVTGPTGSGKSTTLYATLNILNDPAKNIITVEDPVEYRLPGLNQVQVNPKAGLMFATALRSILRSDPDIVMIGEIRDRETAMIAVEAALTGHQVLSTLHTNDSPSAITRLTEMGVEPFLISSALDCVIAQRLARRLCDRCKEPYEPTPDMLIGNEFPWREGEPLPKLYRPVGCQHCAKTGFRGRISLFEVMLASEEVERLTAERRPSDDIKRVAIAQGMQTLREDGMEKVRLGITSLEEIFRVV